MVFLQLPPLRGTHPVWLCPVCRLCVYIMAIAYRYVLSLALACVALHVQNDLEQMSVRSEARSTLLSSLARRQHEAQALVSRVDSMSASVRSEMQASRDLDSASSSRPRSSSDRTGGGGGAGLQRSVNAASMRHLFEQADAASEEQEASARYHRQGPPSPLWTAAAAAAAAELEGSGRSGRMFERMSTVWRQPPSSPRDGDGGPSGMKYLPTVS